METTQLENQNNEPSTSPPTLQSPEIPPTNPPTPSPTNKANDEVYLAVIREQNSKLEALQRQLTETNQAVSRINEPLPKTREELKEQFYTDPIGVLDERFEKLTRALERTIAPIQETARQFRTTNAIDELISKFKNDSRFAPKWNGKLEAYVRREALGVPVDNLNENTIGIIVVNGLGLQAIGMLESDSQPPQSPPINNNPPTPRQETPVNPPYIAPSAQLPSSQQQNNNKKLRPLTELELRLARERNLSHEQYLELLEMPASSVATSQKPTGGQ